MAAGIFANLNAAEAVVLAVVLAPTDAALGQAVVTEPRLPSRIRQGLNVLGFRTFWAGAGGLTARLTQWGEQAVLLSA